MDIDKRIKDSPVLCDPGTSNIQDMYPVLIMFYQDVQQDHFWDLAVRKFGHKILHHRSVKQGSRVYYAQYRKTG
jgi:hypothetical protein